MSNEYKGHTPGPLRPSQCQLTGQWFVERRANGYKCHTARVYGDPDHIGGPSFRGTAEANAALYADAPELLRQNVELRRAFQRITTYLTGDQAFEHGVLTATTGPAAVTCAKLARKTLKNCPEP